MSGALAPSIPEDRQPAVLVGVLMSFRVVDTVRFLMREGNGGLRPLFQGLTPTLLGIVPYSGTTWLTYETLKDAAEYMPGGRETTTNKVGQSHPIIHPNSSLRIVAMFNQPIHKKHSQVPL